MSHCKSPTCDVRSRLDRRACACACEACVTAEREGDYRYPETEPESDGSVDE